MPVGDDPYWTVEVRRGEAYVHVRRTSRDFESLDVARGSFETLIDRLGLEALPEVGLLMDLRDSPTRPEPEFEQATRPYRETLFIGFGRGGVLVQSAAGLKQVTKYSESDGTAYRIFDDEQQALDHVRGDADETSAKRFVFPGDE